MTFKLPEDLTKATPEELDALHAEARAASAPLADSEDLTDDQLDELEVLADAAKSIVAEQGTRAAATAARAARIESAKARLAEAGEPATAEAVEPEVPVETAEPTDAVETPTDEQPLDVVVPDDASAIVDEQEKEPVMASGKQSVVERAAGRIAEPEVPAAPETPVAPKFSLVAAGDVRGYSAGQTMTFDDLNKVFERKLDGLKVQGRKKGQSDKFALAEMTLATPPELTIYARDSAEVASEKLDNAVKSFYEPNSIVAAGDWGAPSQVIYDIPQIEQAPDGLLNLPSVTVERGGFQHTLGIDFSVITSDANFGFTQTEAQAAAQTTKPMVQPTNPSFIDERLKVIGYGLVVGVLTLKGYPELIKRYTSGMATAFAHYRNKDTINRMLSYFPADGSAIAVPALGSLVQDTLDTLSFYAERTRYKYSLQEKQNFEVVLPAWAVNVFREDLAKRSGWDAINVPDAYINSLFTQRKLNVTWVKDWTAQDLAGTDTGWHTTAQALMYFPGTFVKGGGPVVSYDAVVDYDHIVTNTVVQLFREESTLVAQMLNVAPLKFTIPTGTASERQGRTGKNDFGATATGRTYP